MTSRDDNSNPPSDSAVELLVGRLLSDSGELIPTTEAEVARALAAGIEDNVELPPSLREYRAAEPEQGRIIPIERARRFSAQRLVGWSHAAAALVGAAAALGVLWWRNAAMSAPRTNLGRDPRQESIGAGNVRSNAVTPWTVNLEPPCAGSCCAGIDCESAKNKPKDCASGRRCVRCVENDGSGERYRIRAGRIAPTETLLRLLEGAPDKVLDVCFRVNAVASGDFACISAQAKGDLDEAWVSLPVVASGVDLLTGLSVQLRWHAEATSLGEWSSPIQTNTTVFCSGLAIKPKEPGGELLGTLSVFLDDTYYVELGRAADVHTLVRQIEAIHVTGAARKLFETSLEGDEHFAATLGPMSKAAAESGRWALLEHGSKARVVVGIDYRGEPKLLK